MDIERGCLEIIFNRIPYNITKEKYMNLAKIDNEVFLKYGQEQFLNYSNDEINNIYDYVFRKECNENKDIFTFLSDVANILLNIGDKEPTCKYKELLRFQETSHTLGQDLFTTSLLAKRDTSSLSNVLERKYFAWRPVLRTDNKRLQNILNKGMAENHFHLYGSSQSFILNWISVMNNLNYRGKNFNHLQYRLAKKANYSLNKREDLGILEKVILASYYRCYLFCSFMKEKRLLGELKTMRVNINVKFPEIKTNELQTVINNLRKTYGYIPEADFNINSSIDYCFTEAIGPKNNNKNRILAGERYFMYNCFKLIYQNKMDEISKLYFWRYLSIKNEFRSEIIQVNDTVGFDNFSRYQDRKKLFVNNPVLEKELTTLAIAATCQDQNITSLEARVMGGIEIGEMRKGIKDISKIASLELHKLENGLREIDFYVVIHFPKKKDKSLKTIPPLQLMPRNNEVRERTCLLATRLHEYLHDISQNKFGLDTENVIIKGIDTCSNEIGCRPEVFAQVYRFLLAEGKYILKEKNSERSVEPLKATYHAGEDFLDIIDGLRAIDEVLLFCAYKRDYRIGHALALGIDPYVYYKKKNRKLIMPKQDALDNVVWMMERSVELGLEMDSLLICELTKKFEEYVGDIYYNFSNENNGHQEITSNEYFQAWKLRGDDPYLYESSKKDSKSFINKYKGFGMDCYAFNDKINDSIRMGHRHRTLYHRYHFDYNARIRGEEQVVFEVGDAYIKHVGKLQDMMIHKLALEGIGIECNPSSNFLIGTFDRYDEHPILRFQPIHRTNNFPSRISASINTDDQGVFDTYLENEYAIMAYALQKQCENNPMVAYDIEDIYKWIDRIRALGMEQKF